MRDVDPDRRAWHRRTPAAGPTRTSRASSSARPPARRPAGPGCGGRVPGAGGGADAGPAAPGAASAGRRRGQLRPARSTQRTGCSGRPRPAARRVGSGRAGALARPDHVRGGAAPTRRRCLLEAARRLEPLDPALARDDVPGRALRPRSPVGSPRAHGKRPRPPHRAAGPAAAGWRLDLLLDGLAAGSPMATPRRPPTLERALDAPPPKRTRLDVELRWRRGSARASRSDCWTTRPGMHLRRASFRSLRKAGALEGPAARAGPPAPVRTSTAARSRRQSELIEEIRYCGGGDQELRRFLRQTCARRLAGARGRLHRGLVEASGSSSNARDGGRLHARATGAGGPLQRPRPLRRRARRRRKARTPGRAARGHHLGAVELIEAATRCGRPTWRRGARSG